VQAVFDGHWLVQSPAGCIDEYDLEMGKKQTFSVQESGNMPRILDFLGAKSKNIPRIEGFQHLFGLSGFSWDTRICLWDIRESGKEPCVNIPPLNIPKNIRILEQILFNHLNSSKMHLTDLRDVSPKQ